MLLGGGFGGKKESGQLRFGGKDRPFKRPILPFDIRDRRDKSDYRSSRDDSDYGSSHRDHHSHDRHYDRHRSYKSSHDRY